MKYYMYTDGACDRTSNKAAYAYFIRTEKLFVGIGRGTSVAVNSALAEAEAVGAAAEYMLENVELCPRDICVIKTDSLYVLKNFNAMLRGDMVTGEKDIILENALVNVERLSNKCGVEMSKIKSHNKEVNGNSYVDRLVKYQLAISKMKE